MADVRLFRCSVVGSKYLPCWLVARLAAEWALVTQRSGRDSHMRISRNEAVGSFSTSARLMSSTSIDLAARGRTQWRRRSKLGDACLDSSAAAAYVVSILAFSQCVTRECSKWRRLPGRRCGRSVRVSPARDVWGLRRRQKRGSDAFASRLRFVAFINWLPDSASCTSLAPTRWASLQSRRCRLMQSSLIPRFR